MDKLCATCGDPLTPCNTVRHGRKAPSPRCRECHRKAQRRRRAELRSGYSLDAITFRPHDRLAARREREVRLAEEREQAAREAEVARVLRQHREDARA